MLVKQWVKNEFGAKMMKTHVEMVASVPESPSL